MFHALAYLEKNMIEYGPIDPDYIFVTNEGQYRLSRASAMKQYI